MKGPRFSVMHSITGVEARPESRGDALGGGSPTKPLTSALNPKAYHRQQSYLQKICHAQ